jgi:hypothetical protein
MAHQTASGPQPNPSFAQVEFLKKMGYIKKAYIENCIPIRNNLIDKRFA